MRLFRRSKNDQSRSIDALNDWAATVPGITPMSQAELRSVARVAGIVRVVRMRPREGVPAIEAVLNDGTGQVTAVWIGRRSMPGLTLGAVLIIAGRLGGEPAKLQMINPEYEFAAPRARG